MEKDYIVYVENEIETKKVAKELLNKIGGIDTKSTIILTGDLGTGKTKFTEGILEEYGYEEQISSPTFTIINIYEDYSDDTKPKVCHFDVYRLKNSEELLDIGGEETIGTCLNIIEWGEIVSDIFDEYIHVIIEKIDESEKRKITIKWKKK